MTLKVSESIFMLKCQKIWGKYKIFLMAVYMIFKYSKRFHFAPSFNNDLFLDSHQAVPGHDVGLMFFPTDNV